MDWQGGISIFGLGLEIVMGVAKMIWPTIPRKLILFLLFLGLALMLVWPVSLVYDLFHQPAITQSKATTIIDPATNVEITATIPHPDLFKPGDTAKINIYLANRGPLPAKDVSFGFFAKIQSSSITKVQEDEMFVGLAKSYKGSPKMDMSVGDDGYRTVQTLILSEKESDDLKSANTRLYVLGYIHYQDKNGKQTREFCRWLQPPNTWHLCDGGHNRMISGDTTY
jgi:hypothetical protein